MHPVLIEIHGFRIYTYGILIAAAFLSGILWTAREARRVGIPKEKIFDLSFYIILAALVGSRLFYVFVDAPRYLRNPLEILKIWEGGLVFYGGLIGAILASLLYMKKQGMRFLPVADLFTPGIALGHAIGRLGCLAAGCCHGRPAPAAPAAPGLSWAITFPPLPYSLAPAGIPLYPTQLMESATELTIFLLLLLLGRRKRFEGQILFAYLMLYSATRSVLEIFRGDLARGFVIPPWLSTSQFISLLLFVAAAVFYWRQKKRRMS